MSKKESKLGYIIIGILLIAIGVCLVVFSDSLAILAISIGALLAVSAAVFGIVTIAKKNRGVRFALKITLAIICLVAGITTAIFKENTVSVMVSVFSLLLIVDGSFKLNTAAMSKRYSVGGWWVMLVTSVLIILSAFILAKYTPDDIAIETIWLGITIIVDGISNIFSAIWTSLYEKAEYKEIRSDILSTDDAAADIEDTSEGAAVSEGEVETESTDEKSVTCEEEA